MESLSLLGVRDLTIEELRNMNGGEVSPFTRDLGKALGFMVGVYQNAIELAYNVLMYIKSELSKSSPEDNSVMLQVPPLTLFG